MEKIRRGLVSLFYLFLLFTFFSVAASATTVVKIMPQSETVDQGDPVSVDIQVTPDRPLMGVQVDMTFDTTLLTDAISDGGMFANFELYPAQNQILGYQKAPLSQPAVSGQDNLAQVQFTASFTNTGATSIDLSNVKVWDENGDLVPTSEIEVLDGTITVVDPTSGGGQGTTVKVMPQSASVCQDNTVTVDIQVTPDSPLMGVQVDMTFDTTLLTDAISDGGMFANFELYPAQNQILGYQKAPLSQPAVSGQDNLAQVQFTASSTNTGATSIDLSNVKVWDENGVLVSTSDVTVTDGSVTVLSATSAECSGPPTPDPEITDPADDATIVGTVAIAVEEHSSSDNISYNLLEYYRDTDGDCEANDDNTWNEIVNDTTDAPWGTSWTPVGNGKYILRTTAVDETNVLQGTDDICVTVNNPIPERNILLEEGWNFISILGTLDNSTPEHVLDGISYSALYQYSASTGIWDNVDDFEPGIGYIIKSVGSDDQNIVNLVTKPASPAEIVLYPGWNAIGPVGDPEALPGNAEDVFYAVDSLYPTVIGEWNGEYYDQYGNNENVALGSNPPAYVDTSVFEVKPFKGYWMFANAGTP